MRKKNPHPADALSFTRLRPKSEWKAAKLPPRCWWSVSPSGDYLADCETGRKMALEYFKYQSHPDVAPSLASIVSEMPSELSGIEIAFLEMIDIAARAGMARAIAVSEYWDRCGASEESEVPNAA